MALPTFQSTSREFNMMQTRWSAELNPLLALPLNSPSILKNVALVAGDNVINHRLGRTPVGWAVIDRTTNVAIIRSSSAPLNDLTLTLNSTGAASVNLLVF